MGAVGAVFRFRADIFINAEYFSMQVISIVVPVLNEELAIPYFLDRIRPILQGIEGVSYEILFVDDGSSDRTVEAIKSARAQDSGDMPDQPDPELRQGGGPDGRSGRGLGGMPSFQWMSICRTRPN